MKGKRLVATMLSLLLVVSLLPMTALAADVNTGTLDVLRPSDEMKNNQGSVGQNLGSITNNGVKPEEGQPVNPNSGTVETNYNNGKIANNYGTVNHNDGSSGNPQISKNYGTVNTNSSGRDVARPGNKDGIVENYGLVQTNTSGGSIGTNAEGGTVKTNGVGGTIENNSGTVGSRNDDAEKTPDTNKGNHGEIYGNTGTVIFNDGTINYNGAKAEKNDAGNVKKVEGTTNPNATVVLNQDKIYENYGTVGINAEGGMVQKNYGTVNNGDGGDVLDNYGTVNNGDGGDVLNNYDTVNNGEGGEVLCNYGTVVNTGGTLYEYVSEYTDAVGSMETTPIKEAGTYYGVLINKGDAPEDAEAGTWKNGSAFVQKKLGEDLDLGSIFKQNGYTVIGYQKEDAAVMAMDEDAAGSGMVRDTKYKENMPGRLRLIWEKIKTVLKPSGSSGDPEAKTVKKTVPTSLSGDQLKVGAYVRCGNMTFVIIEVTDTDIRVATANKLTEQDLADMLGCLKKHLSDAQIAKLIGEPELLEQELVNFFFGGRNEHIAFRAARDLFA